MPDLLDDSGDLMGSRCLREPGDHPRDGVRVGRRVGQASGLQGRVGAGRFVAVGKPDVVLHRGAYGVADARVELVNGALGALPQLTELVAAAADWTRARLTFENPHHNPTFETWTRLATATRMLRDVQEELAAAGDMIAACPVRLRDPKYRDEVPALRTREPLSDFLGNDAVADNKPPAAQNPEADRRRAARASSPHAGTQRTAPSVGARSEPPASAPPPRSPQSR